uniref:Chromosome segregation protein SMC n=1 Tax=Mesocestoides corti TaxID=53468 RepID=A0A5K3F7K3_MESCO
MSRLEVAECQAQNVIDSHSSRLHEANLTVSQLKAELEAVRKQYEAENRRLNAKIQEIQVEQKASIKAISDNLAQVQNQRNSLYNEVNGLRNKIKTANQAAAEAKLMAETMKERETILTNTANQSAALLKQAQQKAESQKARADNLSTLLGQLRKRLSESENNRLKALESLKLMTEKSVAADSSIASAKRRCEAAVARADQLNEQLQASNKKAKEDAAAFEKEVSRLKQSLSAVRGDAEKWQHKFENAQTKVENLTIEMNKVSQGRQSAEQRALNQLKEEKLRVTELEEHTKVLKTQMADLQQELSTRRKEATEALQADAERIKTLESRIELDLKPLLDVANVRGDTLSNEVDVSADVSYLGAAMQTASWLDMKYTPEAFRDALRHLYCVVCELRLVLM